MINPNKIRPAKYNPRKITIEGRDALHNSINEFGDISGITYNLKTGNLVTGHQRWETLKSLGEITFSERVGDKFEILIDGVSSGFMLREVSWDLEKEEEANIIANNTFVGGLFDGDKLQSLLDKIKNHNQTFNRKYNIPALEIQTGIYKSWIPDTRKLENINENNTERLSVIKIEIKDEIKEIIIDKILTALEGEEFKLC